MYPYSNLRIDQTYLKNTRAIDLNRQRERQQQPGNSYQSKVKINQKYNIIGFISSGTYGRVYKAVEKPKQNDASPTSPGGVKELYAIKK